MKKKHKKTWIIIGALAIILVIVVMPTLQGGSGYAVYSEAVATTGTLTSYYSFSGNVEVDDSETILAGESTTVRDVYVSENGNVRKDDKLVRLSNGQTIKAGIAGEITTLNVKKDDNINSGDVLMELMDFNSMKVTFKVDEYDVSAITVGGKADVTISALGYNFTGAITRLNKLATQSGDVSYYTAVVELTPDQILDNLLPGMAADVKVMRASEPNATIIKMDCLNFDGYNQPYVLVRDGSGTKQVPVTLGINDGVSVQVLSGVRSGETVLVKPSSGGMMMGPGMMRG